MSILKKHEENIFNILLLIISITMLFRQLCTYFIIVFVIFNILNYRSLDFNRVKYRAILLIALPFLLDVLYIWNNEHLVYGLKMAEKRLSLIIIPLFVIGFKRKVFFFKIIRLYSIITSLVVFCFICTFFIINSSLFFKYINGVELWEMGYKVANQIDNMHAPALNMHLAFVSVVHFYFIFNNKNLKKFSLNIYLNSLFFIISLISVLVINTRMAMFVALLGYLVTAVNFVFRSKLNLFFSRGKIITVFFVIIVFITVAFTNSFPYLKVKFTKGIFKHIDKVGRIDEIDNPNTQTGTLVFRLSMWKAALNLGKSKFLTGYGSSNGKKELISYYKQTKQYTLANNKFPTHNQFLDFFIKFGIVGFIVVIIFMFNIASLGFTTKNPIIISFFIIFLFSNLTDDFLIRFDGIAFSALWVSLFSSYKIDEQNALKFK